jgi:hypothetical protein
VTRGRAMALAYGDADRAYLPGIGTLQRRNSLPGKLGSSGNSCLVGWNLRHACHCGTRAVAAETPNLASNRSVQPALHRREQVLGCLRKVTVFPHVFANLCLRGVHTMFNTLQDTLYAR